MADLTLQREKSFGSFAKELSGIWGDNQESSLMLDTPKDPQRRGHFLGVQTVPEAMGERLQETILLRCDSKEVFGQPLTRSKSKECLIQVADAVATANPIAASAGGIVNQNKLTRSRSKENLGNSSTKKSTDLVRVDSLGAIFGGGFELNDLLGADISINAGSGSLTEAFSAPKPVAQNSAAANTATKRKSNASEKSEKGAKKPRASAKSPKGAYEPPEDISKDPWINQQVKLTRGKYEGRSAFVLGRTEKKYQVQVEGVTYQLEFYGSMFVKPQDYRPAQPKRSRGKKANTDERNLSFGLTNSQKEISASKLLDDL